jgi:hypothetical protein
MFYANFVRITYGFWRKYAYAECMFMLCFLKLKALN